MNYIFILFGSDSTYEAQVMSKFIDELPDYSNVFCFLHEITNIYVHKSEKVHQIVARDHEDNEKALKIALTEGEVSGIFIFDYNKIFFSSEYDNEYKIINFNLKWLEGLNVPINIVDFLDFFEYDKDNILKLKNSAEYNIENYSISGTTTMEVEDTISLKGMRQKENIEQPQNSSAVMVNNKDMVSKYEAHYNIIKVSPPAIANIDSTKKFLYWNFSNTEYETTDMERMKAPLMMTPTTKNIFLMFSPAMQFQSAFQNKVAHYLRVVKTIITHLKELNCEINLFISSFDKSPELDALIKGTKIKYRTFKILNYDWYKTLIFYCDAFITDTSWNPALVDAASLSKPAGVIGNSLYLDENGEAKSEFDYTNPEVLKLLQEAIQKTPHELFPYISYPLKHNKEIEFGFHDEKMLYYMLDIYSTESFLSFIDEFAIRKEEVYDSLVKEQHFFTKRAEKALSTEALLSHFIELNQSIN